MGSEEGAFSYERGTPVGFEILWSFGGAGFDGLGIGVQSWRFRV